MRLKLMLDFYCIYLDAVECAPISQPPSKSSSESCSIGGILDCGNGASANKSPSKRPAAGSSVFERIKKAINE